jgi:hypothetical protein
MVRKKPSGAFSKGRSGRFPGHVADLLFARRADALAYAAVG